MLYTITDAKDQDLLGCQQEGIGSATCAARTLMEDGHSETRIWPEGWRFPSHVYTRDTWGAVVISTTDLARSLR